MDVVGDTLLEKDRYWYDADGDVVVQANIKRHAGDTTTLGWINAGNAYATSVAHWYDAAGRRTHSANIGHERGAGTYRVFANGGSLIDTNQNGIPDLAEGTALEPNTSNNYIVSKVLFDSGGNPWRQVDSLGRVTQTNRDLLGRNHCRD